MSATRSCLGLKAVLCALALSTSSLSRVLADDGDEKPGPPPAKVGSSAARMAPRGWDVLQQVKGDLDGDGRSDIVFVLEKTERPDNTYPLRCLVLALKGKDNLYHRSGFSWSQLTPSNAGGASFGDPSLDISIKSGILIINELIGSNDRTSTTKKFRHEADGRFHLIGLTTLNYKSSEATGESRDENLLTGFVEVSPQAITRDDQAEVPLQKFYELRCAPTPVIDATKLSQIKKWPTISVQLCTKQCVQSGGNDWKGAADLSAILEGTYSPKEFFLRSTVRDQKLAAGDAVNLRGSNGAIIKPISSTRTITDNGYVELQVYAMKDLKAFASEDDEERRNISVEIVDFEGTGKHCVMSTADAKHKHSGELLLTKPPLAEAL